MNYHSCANATYLFCWTVSMTLAVSHDWGYTWAHALPPPHHLVATSPYRYNGSAMVLNAGWGDSSGIVKSPIDGYFYTVVHNRFPQGLQSNGSCVIRTSTLANPSSWRGWDGQQFSVPFASPYTAKGRHSAPEDHVCTVLALDDCVVLGVVFSTYLESFVASMACGTDNGGDAGTGPKGSTGLGL